MIQVLPYKFVNRLQLIWNATRNEAEAQGHAYNGTEGLLELDVPLCCLFMFGIGHILQNVRAVANLVFRGPSFGSRI